MTLLKENWTGTDTAVDGVTDPFIAWMNEAAAQVNDATTALATLGTASTEDVGVANGVAPLDASGLVPQANLPSGGAVPVTVHYATAAARLAGGAAQYTMSFQDDTGEFWFRSGNASGGASNAANWVQPGAVGGVTPIPLTYLDSDGTGAANSDTKVMTQKATRIYVANHAVVGAAQANAKVWLDSFQTGSLTDDQLLDAALSYAAAQTWIPIIDWGRTGQKYTLATMFRTPFSGMRFQGPGQGEYIRGKLSPLQVQLTGAGTWFVAGSGNTSCVSMENMNIYGTQNNWFLSGLSGNHNWQQLKLHNVCLNSFQMFLGGPPTLGAASNAFLTTASQIFTGQSNLGGLYGKYGVWVGGSDSTFYGAGTPLMDTPNSVAAGANSGKYMMYCNYLSRSLVDRNYITAENYGGVLVDGSALGSSSEFGHGLIFSHVELQGRDNGTDRDLIPGSNNGSLMRVHGGEVTLDHINVSFFMGDVATSVNTSDAGAITQTGGRLLVDGCGFAKTLAPAIAESTPVVSNTGGECRVVNVHKIGSWSTGYSPRVHGAQATGDGSWTAV